VLDEKWFDVFEWEKIFKEQGNEVATKYASTHPCKPREIEEKEEEERKWTNAKIYRNKNFQMICRQCGGSKFKYIMEEDWLNGDESSDEIEDIIVLRCVSCGNKFEL
jgi:hypothetical protein